MLQDQQQHKWRCSGGGCTIASRSAVPVKAETGRLDGHALEITMWPDISSCCQVVNEALDKPRNISYKGRTDLVTATDTASEAAVLKVPDPPSPVRRASVSVPLVACSDTPSVAPGRPVWEGGGIKLGKLLCMACQSKAKGSSAVRTHDLRTRGPASAVLHANCDAIKFSGKLSGPVNTDTNTSLHVIPVVSIQGTIKKHLLQAQPSQAL